MSYIICFINNTGSGELGSAMLSRYNWDFVVALFKVTLQDQPGCVA